MTETEARQHAAEWDDGRRAVHLLAVIAHCGSVLAGTMQGGPMFTADEISPWDKDKGKKSGELDKIEVAKVASFFGPAVHILGPMGDPEERWKD